MVHLSRHFNRATHKSIDSMYFSIPCDSFFFSLFIVLKMFSSLIHTSNRLCLKNNDNLVLFFFCFLLLLFYFQNSFSLCSYFFVQIEINLFRFSCLFIFFSFRELHDRKPIWVKKENQWTMRIKSVFNYYNLLLTSC